MPAPPGARIHTGAPFTAAAFTTAALMLLFAPLFRGGNRPLALLVLQILALLLLVLLAAGRSRIRLSRTGWAAVLALPLLPLLYLLPLPLDWWAALPGRAVYASALQAAGLAPDAWLSLSLQPFASLQAGLTWLPPVLLLLAVRALPAESLRGLVWLFLGMAVAQALLGLLQFQGGLFSPWRLGMVNDGHNVATGSYVNRNHLAGLLLMALPLLLVPALNDGRLWPSARRRPSGNRSSAAWNWRRLSAWGLLGLLLLGVLLTRSRAGLGLAVLGGVMGAWLLAPPRPVGRRRRRYRLAIGGTLLLVALLGTIAALPVILRFAGDGVDGRVLIYMASVQGIVTFFPFGSGPGSFPEVFHRFHPEGLAGFVNRAHNDYLEWLFDAGLPAAVLLLVLGGLYLRRWRAVLAQTDPGWRTLQTAAGLGMGLLLLHSLVDFNLRIPANMLYFAFLTALFSYRPSGHHRPIGHGPVGRDPLGHGPVGRDPLGHGPVSQKLSSHGVSSRTHASPHP